MTRAGELWIFDMDGTLFESTSISVASFQNTFDRLKKAGVAVPQNLTEGSIHSIYGYTHNMIWKTLFGRFVSKDEQDLADQYLLEEEIVLLRAGAGKLYDGVEEITRLLHKEGANLAIASNGQQSYIETILEVNGLLPIFSGLYSASGYRVGSKVDLVRILLSEVPHERAIMVGDRDSDIEAGKHNGLFTVGCTYGFARNNELEMADLLINDIREIVEIEIDEEIA